jgi:23S rRNA (cytidine1920-2'-O)/16S rRNA (cytidine1409-2'-O)-methyltransferase
MKKITLLELVIKLFQDSSKNTLYSKIMCGEVLVNGEKNTNPSSKVLIDSNIEFIGKEFVSRGGLKLKAALTEWQIEVNGKIFLDAGSSTGGFTDCLLKNGASHVHAVDVGYNQLAYSLRKDKRVSVYEKSNIMHLHEFVPSPIAAVADLSFRSISGAASHIINLTDEKWLIALIKPQFEIDITIYPDFNGIIRDKIVLAKVLKRVLEKIFLDNLYIEKIMLSPIKGRKGNIEFLFLIRDNENSTTNPSWVDLIGKKLDILIDKMQ